jgi:thioredoxin-related protein
MKHYFLIIIFTLIAPSLFSQKKDVEEITWYDIEEAVALNAENPKKLLVYVFSDNCGWCTRMERNTFSNPVIASYINKKYYPVKLNSNVRKDITLGSRTYKFIAANPKERNPAYHELVVTLLNGRLAYPAVAYISEKMAYLGVELGYKPPETMEKWLHFIGEDAYLENKNFSEFEAAFQGELSKN